jgi:ElaB/YqjD/DUF883 family membrane-anchored ribosome-binding protein
MGEGAAAMNASDDLLGKQTPQNSDRSSDGKDDTVDQIREISDTIEETRAQMSQTIEELQGRLSPSHIKARIQEHVREATFGKVEKMAQRASDTMYETRQNVVGTIAANPIPATMIGVGLAWLWMNRRSSSSATGGGERYRSQDEDNRWASYYLSGNSRGRRFSDAMPDDADSTTRFASNARDGVGGTAGKVQNAASELAGKAKDSIGNAINQAQQAGSELTAKAKDRVSQIVDQTQQTAGRVISTAQDQASQAQQRFNRAMDDNPLAVGVVALAVGTAIGLSIPQTRKENEWMGETRDDLVDTAQQAVQDAADQVREIARDPSPRTPGSDQMQPQSGTSATSA